MEKLEGAVGDHESEEEFSIQYLPPMTTQSYPWLIIFNDGVVDDDDDENKQEEERQIFYSVGEDHYDVCSMPLFMGRKHMISCCYDGLSVLTGYNEFDGCKLLNLSTLEDLDLPPLDVCNVHHCVVSSSQIKDNACRVVFIEWGLCEIHSCYVGDDAFVTRQCWTDDDEEDIGSFYIVAVTNFQGKLYAMSKNHNLMSADFSDPILNFKTIIKATKLPEYLPIRDEAKWYLVESCGELLFIYKDSFNHELAVFKIFRANLGGSEWENVRSLGDRAIFLDDHKGLSSSYGASGMGLRPNSIYFVNGAGDRHFFINGAGDRNLYIYDLEDESITLSLPCPIVSANNVSLCWANIIHRF